MDTTSEQIQFVIGMARKAASTLRTEAERCAAYDALSSVEMALTGNATSPMDPEFFGGPLSEDERYNLERTAARGSPPPLSEDEWAAIKARHRAQ